jgi:hypothetical protein
MHPHRARMRPDFWSRQGFMRVSLPKARSSAVPLTQQVLKIARSASSSEGADSQPEAQRISAILSESQTFIWQPKVWIINRFMKIIHLRKRYHEINLKKADVKAGVGFVKGRAAIPSYIKMT